MLLLAGAISLLRISPMISGGAVLRDVLEKNAESERGNDLLVFVVNSGHPLTSAVFPYIF